MESFTVSETFPVKPRKLFKAWLDSKMHGQMVDGNAEIDPQIGGRFSIWDGYITGETVETVPEAKIVQKWRTTDFPEGAEDSILTVEFEVFERGSRLTITHSNLPDGQGEEYREGWIEYYFLPMADYFARG